MLQAGSPCSCLWHWELAVSHPSAAAVWQPGSFGALRLGLQHRSEMLRLCFQVEHLGPQVWMWHLVLFLQQVCL